MEIQIRPVSGNAELGAVGRLRYDVYVRELGRRPPGCDDAQGVQFEEEDAYSLTYAAFDGDTVLASLRMTPVDRLPEASRWRDFYGTEDFPVAESQQSI